MLVSESLSHESKDVVVTFGGLDVVEREFQASGPAASRWRQAGLRTRPADLEA
jgi:hypothetical protein